MSPGARCGRPFRLWPCGLALLLASGPAHAALRSPQVPIAGTALQNLLNAQGQSIDVATQQEDVPVWDALPNLGPALSFRMSPFVPLSGVSLGLFNTAAAAPPLYQIMAGAASAGWFAVATFRSVPARLVVNLFDSNEASQGSVVYLGAPQTRLGWYAQGPGGFHYSEDARNGGAAQLLMFRGTGAHAGALWICVEDSPLPAGGGDYADAVVLVEPFQAVPVPVEHASWGELKSRFR